MKQRSKSLHWNVNWLLVLTLCQHLVFRFRVCSTMKLEVFSLFINTSTQKVLVRFRGKKVWSFIHLAVLKKFSAFHSHQLYFFMCRKWCWWKAFHFFIRAFVQEFSTWSWKFEKCSHLWKIQACCTTTLKSSLGRF